jgi:hypothetical protein
MDRLVAFSAMMVPILLLVGLGLSLFRQDVQRVRVSARKRTAKIAKR